MLSILIASFSSVRMIVYSLVMQGPILIFTLLQGGGIPKCYLLACYQIILTEFSILAGGCLTLGDTFSACGVFF